MKLCKQNAYMNYDLCKTNTLKISFDFSKNVHQLSLHPWIVTFKSGSKS